MYTKMTILCRNRNVDDEDEDEKERNNDYYDDDGDDDANDGKIERRCSCQSGFSPLVRKKVEKVARASECKTLSFLLFPKYYSTFNIL